MPEYEMPEYEMGSYAEPLFESPQRYGGKYRAPRNPYQATRLISKTTSYDDYAPLPRGSYYGYGAY